MGLYGRRYSPSAFRIRGGARRYDGPSCRFFSRPPIRSKFQDQITSQIRLVPSGLSFKLGCRCRMPYSSRTVSANGDVAVAIVGPV